MRMVIVATLVFSAACATAVANEAPAREEAADALRKAVAFFRQHASVHRGYLWRYSADLTRREGEGKAGPSTAWVQPPGTPTIGMAYLEAHNSTGDTFYLDAARETAYALVDGQLQSGGWDYRIEFAPEKRREYGYRVQPNNPSGKNSTTLDDDTTQAAVRFLIRADQILNFEDERIHEAVQYALDCLIKAQYPNGAWPQRYREFPDPAQHPVQEARYPKTWSRVHVSGDYTGYYTLNDNTLADLIYTMLEAARVYEDDRYRAAAEKGGEFIRLAQMPEPQPAWAQQYDFQMHPAWARKFEPPAITGGESQGVMRVLIQLYRETGNRRHLEPLPRALAYLKSSRLPDGKLARFYELESNKPLYFTKDYELTYDPSDTPTHYAFTAPSALDAIEAEYLAVPDRTPAQLAAAEKSHHPRLTRALAERARAIIGGMDERGAWVEEGRMRYQDADDQTERIIDSGTFAANVAVLCDFLTANR